MAKLIRIEHAITYNWAGALRGMRHSWDSHAKQDSYVTQDRRFVMGPNDHELALKLSRAGDSHAKYLRAIFVSMDLVAPGQFWREFDTYKVGTTRLSTSQMHTLGKRFLTMDDFAFDDPDDQDNIETVQRINQMIKEWWDAGKKKPSPQWRKLIENMPYTFLYRSTVALNYQVLKHMYHDRRNHRLQEWREFCEWIETLPYAELITLGPSKPGDVLAIA